MSQWAKTCSPFFLPGSLFCMCWLPTASVKSNSTLCPWSHVLLAASAVKVMVTSVISWPLVGKERDSSSTPPLSEFFSFLQPILDLYMARTGGSAWEPLIIGSSFGILVCGLLLCAEPSGHVCFLPSLHPSWRTVLLTSHLNGFSSRLTLTCPSVSLTPPISVSIFYSNDSCCLSSVLRHALIAPCHMGNSLSVCRRGLYRGEE